MKKIFIVVMILMSAAMLWALDEDVSTEGFSIGFEIGEIGPDLVCGGRLTSPWVFDGHAAARLAADASWKAVDSWRPYLCIRLGLLGSSGMIGDYLRLYGEGGGLMFKDEDGDDSIVFGGYGLFGFEFFTGDDSPVSYFLEAGTNGSSIGRLTGFDVKTGLGVYF